MLDRSTAKPPDIPDEPKAGGDGKPPEPGIIDLNTLESLQSDYKAGNLEKEYHKDLRNQLLDAFGIGRNASDEEINRQLPLIRKELQEKQKKQIDEMIQKFQPPQGHIRQFQVEPRYNMEHLQQMDPNKFEMLKKFFDEVPKQQVPGSDEKKE